MSGGRAQRGRLGALEVEFFRFVNRWLEPRIRAGLGSPRLAPGGLIVLETRGRKTGRLARIPLAATRLRGHYLVGSFRGARAQWARNLAAHPETRFWSGGRPHATTAHVLAPSGRARPPAELPPWLRAVAALLLPYTRAGWTFAILAPRRERPAAKSGRAREGRGRQT